MSENTPMPTNKPEVVLPDWAIAAAFRELDNCQNHSSKECRAYNKVFNRALELHRAGTLTRPADGEFVMVPRSAIDWLNGEGPEGFECPPDRYFRGEPPRYWWRSVFREKAGLSAAPQKHGQEVVAGWSRELLKDLHERLVRSGISDHLDGGSNKAVDRTYIKAAITEAYGLIADLLATTHSESQQPAEAVAAIPSASTIASAIWRDWMTNEQADRLGADIHRWLLAYGALFCPPPAIDIGKLRELVERLKSMSAGERERAKHYSVPARDAQAMHGLARILDGIVKELAALIGDGVEAEHGRS